MNFIKLSNISKTFWKASTKFQQVFCKIYTYFVHNLIKFLNFFFNFQNFCEVFPNIPQIFFSKYKQLLLKYQKKYERKFNRNLKKNHIKFQEIEIIFQFFWIDKRITFFTFLRTSLTASLISLFDISHGSYFLFDLRIEIV